MDRKIYSKYYDDNLIFNHSLINDIKQNEMAPHSHDMYELIYLKDGELTYVVESKKYKIKKNNLIIVRPVNIHYIEFNKYDVYERYDIIFDKSNFTLDIDKLLPKSLNIFNCEYNKSILNLFEKMDFYYKHFRGNELKNILFHLIEEIFYNIIINDFEKEEPANNSYCDENPIIARAVSYIEDNIHQSFTLDELCTTLNITKSYLYQLFVNHLKISPKKYINTKRLSISQKTIRLGSNPTDVYSEFGFSDYATFYKAYKKHFGYAPSEERNRNLSKSSLS